MVHLARGTKIALAPSVLASIYRDLSLLKAEIVAFSEFGESKVVGSRVAAVNCNVTISIGADLGLGEVYRAEAKA